MPNLYPRIEGKRDHQDSKFTGYTALSSTDAQTLGGAVLKLPDNAKSILAVVPYITSPAGATANEPIWGKVTITCDSAPINPLQVLPNPIGASLQGALAVSQPQGAANQVIFPVNCPVEGGEELTIQGTGLFNHTIEPYMGCEVIYADWRPNKAQRHYKLGTFTNTGTAAATAAGSTITVTNGKKLVEVFGGAVGTTVATLKGLCGYFLITSEGWTPSWKTYLPINPASGGVGTDLQEAVAALARRYVNKDLESKAIIADDFHLSVALTTTGNYLMGVGYTRRNDPLPV